MALHFQPASSRSQQHRFSMTSSNNDGSRGGSQHSFHNPLQDLPNPLHLLTKTAQFITKPIVKIGETVLPNLLFFPSADALEHSSYYGSANSARGDDDDGIDPNRMSLEGTLYFRNGKAQGGGAFWKKRLIMLDFEDGGSLACYKVTFKDKANKDKKNKGPTPQLLQDMYSKLHRSVSVGKNIVDVPDRNLRVFLPAEVPWVAKDVDGDSSTFLIEVPTDNPAVLKTLLDFESQHATNSPTNSHGHRHQADALHPQNNHDEQFDDDMSRSGVRRTEDDVSVMTMQSKSGIESSFNKARAKNRPLRFYFKCPRKGNEKALWTRAFAKVGRLSSETRNRRWLPGSIGSLTAANSRIRNHMGAQFARETRHLDLLAASSTSGRARNSSVFYLHKDIENMTNQIAVDDEREFRVSPTYCYPHVWMTNTELREECNLPSKEFHDLRIPELKGQEIGTMRVEVLQCMGIPKLDRNGHSDTVVYLVCGSYAFATDVIPVNANPMWLRKSRRACTFPIFQAYSRLYVGVFDDDGVGQKDDLAGRVVLDLSRLRPGCRYDVTLPLRLSSHVYSRRQRGAVRLRFQLDWHSEKAALMSYIPKKIKFRDVRPHYDTTVMCSDATSFRNITLTVHGIHPPGMSSLEHSGSLRGFLGDV